tara:strand:- start:917 stop:1135 length:219 start_codon:yes stop_codon:yes gene_type:complete
MSNLVKALILKYQGEVEVAKANIDVLLNNPNGVADHPDMASTLDGLVKNLNSAQEQLSTLQCLETDKTFLQD